MIDVSADGISFSGGPFGEIEGILDKFGLDFNDLMAEFKGRYNVFKADLLTVDIEMQSLFNLRPISLPRFPSILQIGSKFPSISYSLELNHLLWDKLAATFPSPTFNGVKIPHIPSGSTFAVAFPRGKFQVELFLPHIAVAFGYAPSFSHPKALSFSMDKLFMPNFGPDLSIKMLDSLKLKSDLIPDFLQLKVALWDKLATAFPSPTFNGIVIPNIPSGQNFAVAFPVRGEFPRKRSISVTLH